MAVYTRISQADLENLISNYNIGKVEKFSPIESGIENSNYFLFTESKRFVLTIYEKRVNISELPFFLKLMNHLAMKGFSCPVAIADKNGKTLSQIKGKSCAIISFLEGGEAGNITKENIHEVGAGLARMHIAGSDFPMQRKNDFSIDGWKKIFASVQNRADELTKGLTEEINDNINYISTHWPLSLPSGIIHADFFPDNVFFKNNKLVGVIDFYFACNDYFMYDLAICLNSWCFEKNGEFNTEKAKALFSGYNSVRKISEEEFTALPILARGASIRFLLTRLYDWLNRIDGALVNTKDPMEYLNKLRFYSKEGIKVADIC